jgi:hypothetical protein
MSLKVAIHTGADAFTLPKSALTLCPHPPVSPPPPTTIHASLLVERAHTSGYCLNPAVGDATLHLAAAIAAPGAPPVLRVPAGVGLILLKALVPGSAFPLASQGEVHRDTSVSCGFKLAPAAGGAGMEIGNLLAKELRQAESASMPEEVLIRSLHLQSSIRKI